MNLELSAAYTDPTGNTADTVRMGYDYSDSPRINQLGIPFGADCLVARVAGSAVVLGQGGYYAPRS